MAYPVAITSFTTKSTGDTIQASHVNDIQTDVVALETYIGTNASQTTPTGSGRVLRSTSASASTWGQVVLTTDVTGVLPIANGGTNASSASITAFNNITGLSAAGTTGTTSTNLVFSTSPTLVTPVLGAASATSINGLTITSSTGTLTITNAKTLSVSNTLTFAGTDGNTLTFPSGNDTVVTLTASQELTNKTLTASVGKGTWTASGTWTLPAITAGGSITLAENSTIALDPAGSADGKYTGITITATAGYAQTYGDLVYLDPTDSRWEQCDANSAAGADGDSRGIIGIVVVAGGSDGAACTILLNGVIRADAKFPTFTVNNPIYVSETAAAVTQTQPTTTDVVIRIVGFALTADEMYFNPENDYITHT